MSYRPYFETADGLVLTTRESFPSEEAALLYAEELLDEADGADLLDPEGNVVPASLVDPGVGVEIAEDDAPE
jgi:hypothetical protein